MSQESCLQVTEGTQMDLSRKWPHWHKELKNPEAMQTSSTAGSRCSQDIRTPFIYLLLCFALCQFYRKGLIKEYQFSQQQLQACVLSLATTAEREEPEKASVLF